MPKILITGNGFDLNYGLPTSYNDFITILNIIENHEINFESVYSKSSMYNQISNNFKEFDFDFEKIDLLKLEIEKNKWHHFFKDEFRIETWIDFENKIEYVLKILFSSVEYIQSKIFSNGSLSEGKLIYTLDLFNNDKEIIEVLNKFNIISLEPHGTLILNKDYLIKKYGFYIKVDLDKIAKFLYIDLIDFKRIFNFYFEIFVVPFYDNLKVTVDRNLFSMINKHYTFNYTPTFEKVFNKVNITRFLHGKIDSNLNQIVLGINEIPNNKLDQKYFLPFTKYFQKLDNKTDYIFIKEYESKSTSNFMFFFMGHSLDKSDEDYINEVFDFINDLRSKIKKIVIIYHNESSRSQLIINLLSIRGRKDIENLMKSKMLIFVHIDSKDLRNELIKDITNPAPMISIY